MKEEELAGYENPSQPRPGLQRADLRQKVWAAAARMPARPRRLLLRRELEGLSYAQIGATLGMSTDKVRRRLHGARALFRKKYAPYLTAREKRVRCRRLGDLISGHYDGELRGMLSRRVADHLAQCPDCRRAEERLASTSELLATLAPTPAPPGLADKLFTSKAKVGALAAAGGGGTIWRLALMLLGGGGFVVGVMYLAAMAWDDGGSKGSAVTAPTTPTPTATPRVVPTRAPTVFAVLTPAAEAPRPEPATATVAPSGSATPVASPTQAHTPETTSEPPPPPPSTPEPPTSTPLPTPTREPTPPPTPEPSPGGIRGVVSCQQQAAGGAQVSVSGPYPGGGSGWVGAADADGGFSTGLILTAGTYVVSVAWAGGTFDSAILEVPDGGYAYAAVGCTGVIGAW